MQSIWQDTIVAAALAVLLSLLRTRSARLRYFISCAALIMLIAWPLASTSWAWAPQSSYSSVILPQEPFSLPSMEPPLEQLSPALDTGSRPLPILPRLLAVATYVWVLGVALMSLWNLVGWASVRRLRFRLMPASPQLQETLSLLALRMNLHRKVVVRICSDVLAPSVIGCLRPIVLVPTSALTELCASQLEALLLHELAHIQRHDYLINLLQVAVESVLFYHPAAWWISSQIRRERENCCDDRAAMHCPSRIEYARALTAMEEARRGLSLSFVLGATGNGDLLRRVERLVGRSASSKPRRSSPLAAGACAALIAIALAYPNLKTTVAAEQPATQPTTHPATINFNTIRPEDLVPGKPTDYRISPNDLLAITLTDLNGPNTETIKQARVTESGNISLPFLKDAIQAAGNTEIELERAIVKAYRDARLIQNASVSVTIIEDRGRTFAIMGAVEAPGNYPILKSDFRLLSAIAEARGTSSGSQIDFIRVLRKHLEGEVVRVIDIPASKALDGDPNFDVIIRPGDTIVVNGAPIHSAPVSVARVIVSQNSINFGGRTVTWDDLAATLKKLPAHQNLILEMAPDSTELTVGRLFDAQRRGSELSTKLGLKSFRPIAQIAPPDRDAQAVGPFVFIGGHVARGGSFSLPQSGLTVKELIKLAGGEPPYDQIVQVSQKQADGTIKVSRLSTHDLFHPAAGKSDPDLRLEAGDEVLVGVVTEGAGK
jgi:protein involved in polysaccharide export with SLBB domain